jgi:hypothetical protein
MLNCQGKIGVGHWNRGVFSTGRLYPTKKPKKTKATPNPTATYSNEVDVEEPQ